jgi:hypothetical protein
MLHYRILPAMLTCIAFFYIPLVSAQSRAQDIVHPFELSWPTYKVAGSLYNSIDFIDSRVYTTSIGIIGDGLLPNQQEKIIFKEPILPQLTGLMQVLTDNSAKEGTIVLQLKKFRFIEQSGVRYCYLSAALYAKKADRYLPLSRLNVVIPLYSRVFKTLQIKANEILTDFLAKGLLVPAQDTLAYSRHEVEQVDSLEKRHIPLYTTTKWVDGLYRNPRAFLDQHPDWTNFSAKPNRDGSIDVVKAGYTGGTQKDVDVNDLYALVYNGIPYIATEFACYPLQQMGNDFYFTGFLKKDAGSGNVPALSLTGQSGPSFTSAITGSTLTHGGLKTLYQVMLDHETGGFIFVRVLQWEPSASPKQLY